MKYIVNARWKKDNRRVHSEVFFNKDDAQKFVDNTKKHWFLMIKNPRIKKVK